jgi:hypothetical protein
MGAGLGGILSFRQATRHAKQLRARDRPRLAAGAASGAFLAAAGDRTHQQATDPGRRSRGLYSSFQKMPVVRAASIGSTGEIVPP